MNLNTAAGVPIKLEVQGRRVELDRLTMADLADIEREILATTENRYVPIEDMYQWAQTLAGAPYVIAVSRRHRKPHYTPDAAADEFGDLMTLASVARALVADSIISGEEQQDQSSATNKKKVTSATG